MEGWTKTIETSLYFSAQVQFEKKIPMWYLIPRRTSLGLGFRDALMINILSNVLLRMRMNVDRITSLSSEEALICLAHLALVCRSFMICLDVFLGSWV